MSGEVDRKMIKLYQKTGDCGMTVPPSFVCDPVPAAATLTIFAPFMFRFALGALFATVHGRGTGRVTAINEEGIRVEYYDGPGKGDNDWIHYREGEFISNLNNSPVTLERYG
jgi:hypothetical protein